MKKYFSFLIFCLLFNFLNAQNECIGTITSVVGKVVVIKLEPSEKLPVKNDSCKVSKDISGTSNPFGFKMTIKNGWLGIAEAKVTKVDKTTLTVTVTKETTSVTENGKKKPQIVVGKRVKVEWK
jgi:hypothetical protein